MRSVELIDVSRSFGAVQVLDGVDITVHAGERLALLGPSGSGKSTLLRLIAGLDDPDAGDIRFDGVSQLALNPHERDVAMVFQSYALYPHLNVLDNISTGLRFGKNMPKADAEQRAREVAASVGIDELLERKPGALSGGQRQRVALARAIARRSGTVLLDEPLSGLDAQLRVSVRTEIFAHLRATGATVIHVTHDQGDALGGADRVAVIDGGRIRQIGTPVEVYRSPNDLFVAQFFGVPRMNALALATTEPGTGRSPFGVHRHRLGSAEVTLGIRPEHLVLGQARPWTAAATVVNTELSGPDHVVYVDLEGAIFALRHAGDPPGAGQVVDISCDPADVHVFAGEGSVRQGSGGLLPLDSAVLQTAN